MTSSQKYHKQLERLCIVEMKIGLVCLDWHRSLDCRKVHKNIFNLELLHCGF